MHPATLAKAMALGAAGAFLYARFGRAWVANWGATHAEINAALPGDHVLTNANLQTTRAITIDVPPERVWPWLVQMGPRPRAGIYTYDWLERLLGIDIENADRLLPEYQHLEAGEFFALNEKGTNGLHVRLVEREHAIVLQWAREESTWAIVLEPADENRTRLISRNRIAGSGPAFRAIMTVMEPGSLLMERGMLRGIKRRAKSWPLRAPATGDGT